MPNETLEKVAHSSKESDMDKKSESETPLTEEIEQETEEKPHVYAKLVVTHAKTAFGKSAN